MHGVVQDVRHALRHLRAHAGYGAAVVLTLALAVGGVTAVFTLADPLLFKPLPFPNADRIVRLSASSDIGRMNMYYADYLKLTQGTASFEAVADYSGPAHVGGIHEDDEPEAEVIVYAVPPQFLGLFGVQPALGRSFRPDEHVATGATVALITHGTWLRAFGGRPDAIGQQLRLHGPRGATFDVIGVLPRGFVFPDFLNRAPGALIPGIDNVAYGARPNVVSSPFARLKPGVTREQAAAEVQRVFDDVRRENVALRNRRMPVLTPLKEAMYGRAQKPLLTLLGLTVLVMLLAFANVSHLVQARARARRGEIATRQALGGSRWRTGRLVFVETALLAVVGLALAVLVGRVTFAAILEVLPPGAHIYRAAEASLSARVLLATAASMFAGLLVFGGIPALRIARGSLREGLQQHSLRTTGRWGMSGLIFAQTGTAIAIVVAALLVAANFDRLANADLGWDPDGIATASLSLPRAATRDTKRAQRAGFALRQRVEALVRGPVALMSDVPGISSPMGLGRADWARGERMVAIAYPASVEFLEVFGLQLNAGRWFTEDEALNSHPVAVVDERTAALLWPGQNAIGQLTRDNEGNERRVIGVVGALKTRLVEERFQRSAAFVPLTKVPRGPWRSAWRGSVTPAMRAELRRFARELEPDGSVFVADLNFIDRQLGQPRFLAILLGSLAAMAGLLTLVGLYGVVSHDATRRTREVGIRIALGADRGAIARLVTGRALVPAALGMALGLSVSVWWTETIRSLLASIEPHDWRVFAASAAVLLVIVVMASWLPIRRATRVDPLIALKAE